MFELGEKKRIVGRDAILDFYREVKAKIRETLEILSVAAGPDAMAVHVATEFYALETGLISSPARSGGRGAQYREPSVIIICATASSRASSRARLKTASVVKGA